MKTDQVGDNSYFWMGDSFSICELETAITFSCKNSAPGLDQIDYAVIRFFPPSIFLILLRIFNEVYDRGLFPRVWRMSLVTFVPKSYSNGLYPCLACSRFSRKWSTV